MANISNLLQKIKLEPISYDRYNSGELKVIGFPGFKNIDCVVKEKLSYSEWISTKDVYPTIKVEGLEKTIKKEFKKFKKRDIHLFVTQKSSYSFKWHSDDVNVYLYVLKGYKRLQIKNKTYILHAGQGAYIPKGHLHRAFSRKNTWALSIGF